ncbi:MAG: NAD-dependent epimerase/dehydratase family protein [Caldilineaceae bacterium SB0662_bin_25]|nr:NAD-dependent epimerase/dehydratase family protein [Caldilineaceae bacterium SB0662_bin_25]
MHVLITGGAGFIGSHLADALLRRGDSVSVLDNLSTGSAENIQGLQGHPCFSFVQAGLDDGTVLDDLAGRADAIVHLAAAVGVHLVLEKPTHTIETNVLGTHALLAAARRSGCQTLIASTSEVYGKSESLPFSENDDLVLGPPNRTRWVYAATKLLDEFLALAAHQEFGLPLTIMRLFNVVGPRQTGRFGMVLPRLVRQALRGQPLTVYGDGMQTRCFCHVADVLQAIIGLLGRTTASGQIYNIGSNQEVTIRELAEQIVDRADSASPIHYFPYSEAYAAGFEDLRRRVPDISKIANEIGWKPTHLLPKILDDMIDFERGRLT